MSNEIKTYDKSYTYGEFDMGFQQSMQKPASTETAVQATQEAKAIAEIQAAYIIAKKFPRNEAECYVSIMNSCKRPSLADQAMYAYPRGKTTVTGPSIRLAEVLAQKWSNCRIGIEIISQTAEATEARAYANDLETNYCSEQGFTVPHVRTTKQGKTRLTDERDIREMVQNIGSRILRGCIMRVIPADIVEAAIEQCAKTQQSSEVPIADQLKRLVAAFDEIGVKVEHLEKRLGHNLDATIPPEIVALRSIYKSIKDGMADRSDFFEIANKKSEDAKAELSDFIEKAKAESKPSQEKEKAKEQPRNKTSLEELGESHG